MGEYIKLTFSEYLTERYNNINELNTLASDIISLMSKDISNGNIKLFKYNYTFNHIFNKIDTEKYSVIQEFIETGFVKTILVSLIPYQQEEAYYIDNDITLNLNPNDTEFKILSSEDEKAIYYLLQKCYLPLIHELQHAYDDYRSGGRYIKKSYTDDFGRDLETYYRSDHELNAYFSQIISSIRFYEIDYEMTPTSEDDGVVIIVRKMIDFDIIKKDYIEKFKFKGWDYLTDDIKKEMLHQLGKYYITVNEKIHEYNQEKHTKDFF